jgi:hypothetical protein
MNLKRLKGKKVLHPEFGSCIVTDIPKKSRVNVEVTVVERKAGWNEYKQCYEPYKEVYLNPDTCPGAVSIYWRLTRRDEYGHKEIVNVNNLIL